MDNEFWIEQLVAPMYENRIIQTIRNTDDEDKRNNGWILKSKLWSPWFLNLRHLGEYPYLFHNACQAMTDMIEDYPDIDLLVGVEMAGIPLVGGVAIELFSTSKPKRIAYTRPLPQKVRTVDEATLLLAKISTDVAGYGQKSYVEGILRNNDKVAIFDDMSTTLDSKLITREIVLWESFQKGVSIDCNTAFYLLNRNKSNRETAERIGFNIDYVIEFDDCLPYLKEVMDPMEFELISAYQANPGSFQNDTVQRQTIMALSK